MRTLKIIVVIAMVQGVVACDSAPAPTAPTPLPQAAPQPTPGPAQSQTQLTGAVLDTAFRPLTGASVEVVAGSGAGAATGTDADGQFTLTGTFDDTTRVRASREGHLDATEATRTSCLTCIPPRRWIYFYLAVLAPAATVAGDYTLTLTADSACADLPGDVQTRTYNGTIRPGSNPGSPAGTYFDMVFTGATLLPGWDRIPVGVAGDLVALDFRGDWVGLVERVAPRATLAFGGRAEFPAWPSGVTTVATTFGGVIDYCVLKTDSDRFYECGPSQADTHVTCEAGNHRVVLSRR